MLHGRVSKSTFTELISKMRLRLASWENKKLSMAGRVRLVKSVLSAIPGYLMQTIYLPDNVIQEIYKLIRGYGVIMTGYERCM